MMHYFKYFLPVFLYLCIPTLSSAAPLEKCSVVYQQYTAIFQDIKLHDHLRNFPITRESYREFKFHLRSQQRIRRKLQLIEDLYVGCFQSRAGHSFLDNIWKKKNQRLQLKGKLKEIYAPKDSLLLVDDYFRSHRYITAGWVTFGITYGLSATSILLIAAIVSSQENTFFPRLGTTILEVTWPLFIPVFGPIGMGFQMLSGSAAGLLLVLLGIGQGVGLGLAIAGHAILGRTYQLGRSAQSTSLSWKILPWMDSRGVGLVFSRHF